MLFVLIEKPGEINVAEEVGMRLRYPKDDGTLPHISPSGRIYGAELELSKGECNTEDYVQIRRCHRYHGHYNIFVNPLYANTKML